MKTLKVYEDVHTAVKVAAAQLGRTTTNVASSMLRRMFSQIAAGDIALTDIQPVESDPEDTEDQEPQPTEAAP